MWKTGNSAKLKLCCHAGEGWVSLHVGLGSYNPVPPHTSDFHAYGRLPPWPPTPMAEQSNLMALAISILNLQDFAASYQRDWSYISNQSAEKVSEDAENENNASQYANKITE